MRCRTCVSKARASRPRRFGTDRRGQRERGNLRARSEEAIADTAVCAPTQTLRASLPRWASLMVPIITLPAWMPMPHARGWGVGFRSSYARASRCMANAARTASDGVRGKTFHVAPSSIRPTRSESHPHAPRCPCSTRTDACAAAADRDTVPQSQTERRRDAAEGYRGDSRRKTARPPTANSLSCAAEQVAARRSAMQRSAGCGAASR